MQNPDPINLHVGRRLRLAGKTLARTTLARTTLARTTLGYARVELVDVAQSLGRPLAPTPQNATP